MPYRVEIGDITGYPVDAIVNAANPALLPGGGVCGAIHRAGGPSIAAECRRRFPNGIATGEAVATTAGDLPARFVIHAVGPIFGQEADPDARLADAYRNSLRVARDVGARSVAFPALSTGIYGFPPERAAPIVRRVMEAEAADLDVVLVFFTAADARVFGS